jgi:hypothetical protein
MPKYMLKLISQRKSPSGTPIMAEITNIMNNIRRHYWEA